MWYNYMKSFYRKADLIMSDNRTILFNDNWFFKLLPIDSGYDTAVAQDISEPVEIPHDWLIFNTNDLYASGEGWYKKVFTIENKGDLIYSIDFDGIYTDSSVYVNGEKAGDWHYGYSSFSFDITSLLKDGENVILVQVRHKAPNSRWYSGAGIYRNVYLTKVEPIHIARDGVYISADGKSGEIKVSAEVIGPYDSLRHTVIDADGNTAAVSDNGLIKVDNYKLWSLEDPYLYTLKTEVISGGNVVDTVTNIFGFRWIKFDANEGFFLNGEYMKLKGVCLHHDLGALGSAVNYRATERQVLLMKEMGVNAIRTSHNMPSREFLEICDRVGMLVDCESFDMWEMPKTEFDNARFFKNTAHADVLSWVRRDRNHPSVIMWSIGNEIYDTHASEHGYEIAEMLRNYVLESDPNGNALPTIGSNFIEWENSQKIGKMLGISGYNYTEKCYDDHHKKYPDTVIYGSETSSAVRSRGIYHFPADMPLLSHDDHQCSSLANSCVGWGRPAEDAWIQDRDRKFCAGQFIWTGIDYIGEPTPYSTKNSYFGAVDTAGIPKDIFYFYQSAWTDVKSNPMIHLLPYWDFNEGQLIDVIAYTNAPRAELFVNGKSYGVQEIDHKNGAVIHAHWEVPYEKGEILVKAADENGTVIAEDIQKSFGDPAAVKLSADRTEINADGKDLVFVEISTADENGVPVANARNRISVEVSGAGRLLGLDNGDSTDYEQYKTDCRKLFSGKLMAVIGSVGTAGDIVVKASSLGLAPAEITVKAVGAGIPNIKLVEQIRHTEPTDDVPIRKIEASSVGGGALDENRTSLEVKLKIFPENATYNDITCKIVQKNSVETNIAEAELRDGSIFVAAKGDGECILRIYANNGSEYPQVISDVPLTISGLGSTTRDPYTFVSACYYDSSSIPVNILEKGALGGFTEPCRISYANIDFGKVGTDELRLYIGNCMNRDIPVEIFDGECEDEKQLIMTAMFPHNNGWDYARPYDFKLPSKLKGIHTLSFKIADKCIFGGFEFTAEEKAFAELSPADNDALYGDDYAVNGGSIEKIGNNVVIGFNDMDFGAETEKIVICGRTPNEVNTIQLRYTENGTSKTQLLEFVCADEYTCREFALETISGMTDISFVFLPGSNFDFRSFRFIRK